MGQVEDADRFRALIARATAAVGSDYFMLPVADQHGGQPLIQYRERVYAYELYHQLRSVWPDWQYSLGGEIDKRGHPVVRGGDLDLAKPDLLVHVPGKMDDNLVVVEIKAAGPHPPANERTAIETDLKKLVAFCARAEYRLGLLLVFGEHVDRIAQHLRTAVEGGVRLDNFELWHHPQPRSQAYRFA
jgi:hypothetical protein